MTSPGSAESFRVEFSPEQLGGFLRALKAFEPALATATRRRLRQAGAGTIDEMRQVVASGPGNFRFGVKRGIQSGLKTAVVTGKRRQGVRLSATAAAIPGARKPMLRLFNKASFRHPVFGDRDTWVTQRGRPYFGTVIKRHEDEMLEAVMQALGDAFETMVATT